MKSSNLPPPLDLTKATTLQRVTTLRTSPDHFQTLNSKSSTLKAHPTLARNTSSRDAGAKPRRHNEKQVGENTAKRAGGSGAPLGATASAKDMLKELRML